MKYLNCHVLSGLDSGSVTGATIDSNQFFAASFHFISGSGTTAGTVKVQVSNDLPTPQSAAPIQNFVPTNWVDLPSATATITAGSQGIIPLSSVAYRWMRVIFTRSAGAGDAVTCNLMALEM